MHVQDVNTLDEVLEGPATPLFGATLFKAIPPESEDAPWRFAGIASDEDEDVEGDRILKKSIDLTYAKQRGYVNWDHSRSPGDQLGYLTKAEVISKDKLPDLKKAFPDLGDQASVYVEGELYKHVPKAAEVYNIMKSVPNGGTGSLGLSLDGSIARDVRNGGIIKAFVRGVALTAQPVQPKTLVRLRKSLAAYNELSGTDGMPSDLPAAIAGQVVEQLQLLQKSATLSPALDHDKAVLYVLKQRPRWSYELASKIVTYTMEKAKRS